MFDKSTDKFPIKQNYIYLNACRASPLYRGAVEKECEFARYHMNQGTEFFTQYGDSVKKLHIAAAALLKTTKENISFLKSTAEGINFIANAYPFKPDDEIISFEQEYPSNHYPWRLQSNRGVQLILVKHSGQTGVWSFDDLKELVTKRTRLVAISHVQFTSGFAANLEQLGEFCQNKGIDLVIDGAQSMGCLPLYPEEMGISAIAASGWKWLMGPIGTGIFYTAPEFRKKLSYNMAGPRMMQQGQQYLDHTWRPYEDGRRFEYSSLPYSLASALESCMTDISIHYGMEQIRAEVFRLIDIFLGELDQKQFAPLIFPDQHRSGILAIRTPHEPVLYADKLAEKRIICTPRGEYLRISPHIFNTDDEVREGASVLNGIRL
ncbi:hypothetical protein PN36_17110 [Candidatus Thiomargarita nelsonii]|uniref:Aminotransferase class V domain-containing protein n=1 Tax=Candidatus Thiomargarita nelsonii TaxID=1003181 RepID=A0A0A6P6Z7_9GAMM|nr:hypothetical protein PN36_17110 [Candidatus Thiomargarita nelsonii]